MDMGKMEDWLSTIPSEYTRKNYKSGIKKFEKFYPQGIETLIGSKDAGKIIDKFFVWLKENGHPQNTRRNLTNAPIQFLKYFNTEVKYSPNLDIYKTVVFLRRQLAQFSLSIMVKMFSSVC